MLSNEFIRLLYDERLRFVVGFGGDLKVVVNIFEDGLGIDPQVSSLLRQWRYYMIHLPLRRRQFTIQTGCVRWGLVAWQEGILLATERHI